MKYTIRRSAFAVVVAAYLIAGIGVAAEAQDHDCSLAHSAGHWSFTDNGTVVGVGPRTAVGVWTLDGHGNLLNGVAASSLNGSIASETFSGTYTVNSDCSGTVECEDLLWRYGAL